MAPIASGPRRITAADFQIFERGQAKIGLGKSYANFAGNFVGKVDISTGDFMEICRC